MGEIELKNNKLMIISIILLVIIGGILITYILRYNYNRAIANENFETLSFENHIETDNMDKGQPIEITINNWQDYIELEDVEETSRDDFGEITSTSKYTILKFKKNVIGNDNVQLKLKYNDEVAFYGENWKEQIIKVYDGSDDYKINYKLNVKNKNGFGSKDYDSRITIDNFEVINAKGTIYIK